jgi:hypothetical protein
MLVRTVVVAFGRWASAGLMPVRPVVVLMNDVKIAPQKALRLTKW